MRQRNLKVGDEVWHCCITQTLGGIVTEVGFDQLWIRWDNSNRTFRYKFNDSTFWYYVVFCCNTL